MEELKLMLDFAAKHLTSSTRNICIQRCVNTRLTKFQIITTRVALPSLSEARSQVLRFCGQNKFYGGEIFVFIVCL